MAMRPPDGAGGDPAGELSVPADFAAALAGNERASQVFAKMPESHKQRWVWSVVSAKAEQTRQRRIARAVQELGQR